MKEPEDVQGKFDSIDKADQMADMKTCSKGAAETEAMRREQASRGGMGICRLK